MTVGVVDFLELIQIDVKHTERLLLLNTKVDVGVDRTPVSQSGQRILRCLQRELFLSFLEQKQGLLELFRLATLAVAQPFFFEACADTASQQDPIERFGEVVLRAQLNALHHAAELVQGRDHNHRNITQPDVFLHVSQRFETVQFRHHDIEQNEIARVSLENRENFFTVPCIDWFMTLGLQVPPQHVAICIIIVGHDDGSCGTIVRIVHLPRRRFLGRYDCV